MNAHTFVKRDTEDLHTEKQSIHLAKKLKSQLLAEVPEETVWLANFTSRHTKKTYLYAVREFIALHEITGVNASAGS